MSAMNMNKKNLKLKNISYISAMTPYNKTSSYLITDTKHEHQRGKSSNYQLTNGIMSKTTSLLKENNYLSSSKRSKDIKNHSQSKVCHLTHDNFDPMIKSSSSFSMFHNRYLSNTKRYTGLVTDGNVKSGNTSSEYLLMSSPSTSSSICKSKNSSLKNIQVFYSELSKHLKKDSHQPSNNQTQIKVNSNSIGNKIKKYCDNMTSFEKGKDSKVFSSRPLNNQQQPSTKATKESTVNSMQVKGNNCTGNCSCNCNSNSNSNTNNGTCIRYIQEQQSNLQSFIDPPNRKNIVDNTQEYINNNDIDTPEELHYFYVNILQNGKEIEHQFDRTNETN